MWLMVVLRVAAVGAFGVAGEAFPDRDAVSDGDLLRADEDVLDEQSEHPLALLHRGDLGIGVELSEKTLQIGGEGEVGLTVGELGIESVNLVAQVGFSRTQVGQSESVVRGHPSGGDVRCQLFRRGRGAHGGWNERGGMCRLTAWNAGQQLLDTHVPSLLQPGLFEDLTG